MNELTTINKMTSMQIAEVTGKRHSDIMRDIRDEIEKLENGGIEAERKFALSERQDSTGRKIPYYILTKEGVLQLAARYDAVVRAKLIELVIKHDDLLLNASPELQAIFVLDKRSQEQDKRITKLENTMTIDYSQQEELRELANSTVINALGGKNSEAYKKIGNKAFARIWRDYKNAMQVNTYRNTAVKDYEKGKQFLKEWKPDQELSYMIIGANSGIEIGA